MQDLTRSNELTQKYNALESFENYNRQENTNIRNFLTEFENHFHKTRSYGTVMSDDLLAYHLIKSAKLTTRDKQLVKATINKLSYDIKSKLIKFFRKTMKPPLQTSKSFIASESQYTMHRTTFTMKLLVQTKKKSL